MQAQSIMRLCTAASPRAAALAPRAGHSAPRGVRAPATRCAGSGRDAQCGGAGGRLARSTGWARWSGSAARPPRPPLTTRPPLAPRSARPAPRLVAASAAPSPFKEFDVPALASKFGEGKGGGGGAAATASLPTAHPTPQTSPARSPSPRARAACPWSASRTRAGPRLTCTSSAALWAPSSNLPATRSCTSARTPCLISPSLCR